MIRNHKLLRRSLAVAATIGLAASLAACSSNGSGGDSTATASGLNTKDDTIAAMVPEAVAKAGALNVAGATYPPALIEDGDGTITGWDAETIREIGNILGLKINIQLIPFDNVVPGLQANKYDAAMGEIYITPKRTDVVTFVTTHNSADVLMVPKDSKITSASTELDLCGLNLTAGAGSAEEALITELAQKCADAGKAAITPTTFANVAQSNLALSEGRVDGAINSASQVSYTISQTGDKFRIVQLPWAPAFDTGIALARNDNTNDLAMAMQAAVNLMIENGTLQQILDKFNNGEGMIKESLIVPTIK